MIERYTRPHMKAIWDLKHKYEIWLEVELQATAAFERSLASGKHGKVVIRVAGEGATGAAGGGG